MTLQVEGLTARLPGGGPLVLDDVRFTVRRGWLVGVLGPTGAGKTSLLAALTGRLTPEAGTVQVVGRAAHVPQDDVLHGRLGLRRTLHHAATLRLPRGTGGSDRRARIDGVLADLGLAGKASSAIDTLSGGERKRANVAVELVGQPDIVLLDEPTSGLDPGHEQTVLAALRRVADGGRTVIAVTHGLAALSVCDRVLVLGRGGRVAFFGPPAAAKAFFGSVDAATLFRDLDGVEGTTRWADRFVAHPAYDQLVAGGSGDVSAVDDSLGPRRRTQLATLVHRAVELVMADRRRLALLGLQGPILGLLLLAVLRPNGFDLNPFSPAGLQLGTVAMFLAVSATWLGAATAVREIIDELPIVRRERGAGLSLGVYVASKALVLGGIAAAEAAVLASVAILRQAPPAVGAVLPSGALEIVVVAGLVALAAVALGLCVSALVTTSEKALTVLPLVLVAQLVLAGPWAAGASTPGLGVFRSLTVTRWGAQAIEATGRGDRGAWWSAVAALVALLGAALVATWVLVRRRAGVRRVRPLRAAALVAGSPVRAEAGSVRWVVPAAIAAAVVGAFLVLPNGSPGSGDGGGGVAGLVAANTLPGDGLGGGGVPSSTTAPTVPSTTATTVAGSPSQSQSPTDVPVTEPATRDEVIAPVPVVESSDAPEAPPVEPPATTVTTAPPAPTTTATTAPPPTTSTTIRPSGGGGTVSTASSGPWDWVLFWWDMAQAFR